MEQTEGLFKRKHWLDAGRCLTRDFLQREPEVPRSTLKRENIRGRQHDQAGLGSDRSSTLWLTW